MPTIDPVKDPEDEQAGKIGKAWQAAIDFGIDVSLLEENLRLTPEERLAQLVAMQRLFDALQSLDGHHHREVQ